MQPQNIVYRQFKIQALHSKIKTASSINVGVHVFILLDAVTIIIHTHSLLVLNIQSQKYNISLGLIQ